MKDYQETLAELLPFMRACELETEWVPLQQALNRCLSQDYFAQFDAPSFDHAAMDGYAVKCFKHNQFKKFSIVGRQAAGESCDYQLKEGECIRIFTGAATPSLTDAVIAQEDVMLDETMTNIEVRQPIVTGQHIRFKGEELKKGDLLLKQGLLLQAAQISLLASQGYAKVAVYRKLRIVIFSSGNELLELGETWQKDCVFDANRYQLMGLMQYLPIQLIDGGILLDDPKIIEDRFQAFLKQDVDFIVTSGGASVGEEDYLKSVIQSLGHLSHWRLAIKPGKPFGLGRLSDKTQIMMLPGNPVATFVLAHILVLPLLKKAAGLSQIMPIKIKAYANFLINKVIKRREFLRVLLNMREDGTWQVERLPHQSSAALSSCAKAHGLAEIPPYTAIQVGDALQVIIVALQN